MAYDNRPPRKEYDNTNRGILFLNKSDNPKAPDFKGSLNVDGREYWISGWKKVTQKGPAVSVSIEAKQQARRDQYESNQRAQAPADDFPEW